jgi:ribose/xylose/arabinose/galactoside ABC-type transport system permease subunit
MEPDRAPDDRDERTPARPGRDRVWPHLVWEVLLVLAVVVAALAVRREQPTALSGNPLRDLLVLLTVGVLLGTAFALSLRAAVPNLAVGGAAVAASALVAWLVGTRDYSLLVASAVTLGAALALGIGLAVVVVGFRAPAWAAGLGAGLGLFALVLSLTGGRSLLLPDPPDLRDWAWPLIGGAVAVSLLGGVLGMLPGVRAGVGRYRPAGDPAASRGAAAAVTASAALIGSSLLAAGAGILLSMRLGAVVPDDGLVLLAQAAAAALLGGTSAHGRRGGVVGTILAAAFLQLAALWLGLVEAEPWTRPALLGAAILVGLLVGRLVEAAGSTAPPESEPDPDGPDPEPDPYATQGYQPYRTGTFQPVSGREEWWQDEPTRATTYGSASAYGTQSDSGYGPGSYASGTAPADRPGAADRPGPADQPGYRSGADQPGYRTGGDQPGYRPAPAYGSEPEQGDGRQGPASPFRT